MAFKINTYFSALIIAIFGAAAALIIVHVAYANTFSIVLVNGATQYSVYLEGKN